MLECGIHCGMCGTVQPLAALGIIGDFQFATLVVKGLKKFRTRF